MAELGAGLGTSYPTTLDTDAVVEANDGEVGETLARAEVPNDLAAAVVAIETEVGVAPSGTYANLVTRLANMPKDRGDPSAYDFTLANFTTDNTWKNLDLSGIVSAGARWVIIYVEIQDNAVGSILAFKKNLNNNAFAISCLTTQAVDVAIQATLWIPVGTARYIDYKGTYSGGAAVFTAINLTVLGWIE